MVPSANGANMVVLDRVFVLLITEEDKMPMDTDWKGEFVVSVPPTQEGQGPALALVPVQNIMQVPSNAVLCSNPNEGILLLQKVKAELKPNMSGKSGLQACVVHTEAIFDLQNGHLAPNLMLFPVGFMPYDDMVKPAPDNVTVDNVTAMPKAPAGDAQDGTDALNEGKPVDNPSEGTDAPKEAPTVTVEGPADNPAPTTATLKVEAAPQGADAKA